MLMETREQRRDGCSLLKGLNAGCELIIGLVVSARPR